MIKRISFFISGIGSAALLGFGVFGAIHSQLFAVRVIEVSGITGGSPATEEEIMQLGKVPLQTTNLFSLELDPIRERILTNPWIKNVTVTKKFPQSVAIKVEFRRPELMMVSKNGILKLIDEDGFEFFDPKERGALDLPIVSGVYTQQLFSPIKAFLIAWSTALKKSEIFVSEIKILSPQEARIYFQYRQFKDQRVVRSRFDVNLIEAAENETSLRQLAEVIQYVQNKNWNVSYFFRTSEKKIVVRIARES